MFILSKKRLYIHIFLLIIISIAIVWWMVEIKQGKMPYVDQWTRGLVSIVEHTRVYTFFRGVTELGSKSFLLPFTIVMMIFIWIIFRNALPAFTFGIGTLGAQMLNKFIKNIIARERPSISALLNAQGYSFPSGHAMISIVCYGLLAYFLSKKFASQKRLIQFLFGFLILLIGLSRYFINVHYLTDIITGFFFGYLYLRMLIYLYEKFSGREKGV